MIRPKRWVGFVLVLFGAVSAWGADIRPGEVIVKYKAGVLRARSDVQAFQRNIGVKKVKRFAGSEHWILGKNADMTRVMQAVRSDPSVEYVQPNYVFRILPVVEKDNMPDVMQMTPDEMACRLPGMAFVPQCGDHAAISAFEYANIPMGRMPLKKIKRRPEVRPVPEDVDPPVVDPDLDRMWGLRQIQAPDAWGISKGSRSMVVADIDTGIDYNHEDLAANLWRNPEPSDAQDVVGYDFIHEDGLPFDDNGHGTHTAGTIGAVGDNGVGISGVAQQVSIMALKFLSGDGSGTSVDAIRAIDYAVAHGARVLNNSWGGRGEASDPDNMALRDAIERARKANVLFVAAAGNEGYDNDTSDASYPAAFKNRNIIAVAATDHDDDLAYFSNFGKESTHLAAPGVAIYSTIPNNRYREFKGTSMACPHVVGAAAVLWASHPTWSYARIKRVLMETVDPVSALKNVTVTGGRVNLLKALQYKLPGRLSDVGTSPDADEDDSAGDVDTEA